MLKISSEITALRAELAGEPCSVNRGRKNHTRAYHHLPTKVTRTMRAGRRRARIRTLVRGPAGHWEYWEY